MRTIQTFAGGLLALAVTSLSPAVTQATGAKAFVHGKIAKVHILRSDWRENIKVFSHGNTAAVMSLPKSHGGRVYVQAHKMTFGRLQGAEVLKVSGDVHIKVVQKGVPLIQITADEAELDSMQGTTAPRQ